jgi:hypothetical protein
MMRSLIFTLALVFAPAAVLAQVPPPALNGDTAPSAQQMAAMQQMHAQMEGLRVQTRTRMLAALTPQHRAAIANIVGQLAVAPNPDQRGAAQALDAVLAPVEKQSILTIDAAQRANMHALMQQQRAAFEATLSADQRARLAQHWAKTETFRQSHPRPTLLSDPGAIVLRTLGNFGPSGGLFFEVHGARGGFGAFGTQKGGS